MKSLVPLPRLSDPRRARSDAPYQCPAGGLRDIPEAAGKSAGARRTGLEQGGEWVTSARTAGLVDAIPLGLRGRGRVDEIS